MSVRMGPLGLMVFSISCDARRVISRDMAVRQVVLCKNLQVPGNLTAVGGKVL